MFKALVQDGRLSCSRRLGFCFRFGAVSRQVEAAAAMKFLNMPGFAAR